MPKAASNLPDLTEPWTMIYLNQSKFTKAVLLTIANEHCKLDWTETYTKNTTKKELIQELIEAKESVGIKKSVRRTTSKGRLPTPVDEDDEVEEERPRTKRVQRQRGTAQTDQEEQKKRTRPTRGVKGNKVATEQNEQEHSRPAQDGKRKRGARRGADDDEAERPKKILRPQRGKPTQVVAPHTPANVSSPPAHPPPRHKKTFALPYEREQDASPTPKREAAKPPPHLPMLNVERESPSPSPVGFVDARSPHTPPPQPRIVGTVPRFVLVPSHEGTPSLSSKRVNSSRDATVSVRKPIRQPVVGEDELELDIIHGAEQQEAEVPLTQTGPEDDDIQEPTEAEANEFFNIMKSVLADHHARMNNLQDMVLSIRNRTVDMETDLAYEQRLNRAYMNTMKEL